MDTSSSQSKTSHLSSAMVTLYIHMGKLRNSFYEIKYTETFSTLMTHKISHNDDKGNFINSERIEVAKIYTSVQHIFCTSLYFIRPPKVLSVSVYFNSGFVWVSIRRGGCEIISRLK